MIHHVHLLYLKNISYIWIVFCCPATLRIKLWNLWLLSNNLFLPRSQTKIHPIILLSQNNHIPRTNCFSFPLESFLIWYKLKTKTHPNLIPLNIHHPSAILLFLLSYKTVLFEISPNFKTRTNEIHLILPSSLSHTPFTAMTEQINFYNHPIYTHNVSQNRHKQHNLLLNLRLLFLTQLIIIKSPHR